MKALVLGGTGAIGVHLVELLANDRVETFVTTREKREDFQTVHYINGNAHDEEFLLPLLKKQWDVIVDFMLYTTEEFKQKINFLLDTTQQYIFISSCRVYADHIEPITENSKRILDVCNNPEYLTTDEYALSKARQENILRQSGRYNWTIVRPYITYSEIRLQLGIFEKECWLYRTLHGQSIIFTEDILHKRTTLTYGFDVASGIKSLMGNVRSYTQDYNISTSQSITWGELSTYTVKF